MKIFLLFLTLFLFNLQASQTVIFGSFTLVEKSVTKKQLTPLLKYLENKTNTKIELQTGYNYKDTIEKFCDGTFDIGLIGPSPYITAKQQKNNFFVLAQLQNTNNDSFKSVIVSKKASPIHSLQDLKGKTFAFGSPQSTLSYYIPMNMLIESQMISKLKRYNFLGRHDRVAQYVIMGKYDAGAIKKSVAKKYSKYLQKVAASKSYPDFLIIANKSLDAKLLKKFESAFLELKDKTILQSIKKSAVGFEKVDVNDYKEVETIMHKVDVYKK